MTRILQHPILGEMEKSKEVKIIVDGKSYPAYEGEMIAAALISNGIKSFRYTKHQHSPRGIYCGIGRCTDCVMIVNGVPNVRTCITPVAEGMTIETQYGAGAWKRGEENA
ncbi:MAG: (2Fe-2S)-binding protein [Thermotaleaceae bacterium]